MVSNQEYLQITNCLLTKSLHSQLYITSANDMTKDPETISKWENHCKGGFNIDSTK